MKIYLKYIFLFLIAGSIFSSCNQKDEKVYSFWALQNRATGEYLYAVSYTHLTLPTNREV